MDKIEPILKENKDKFVIFPVKHHDIWDFYKKIKSAFWTSEEIDLHQDIQDWNNKLSKDERHFVKHILALPATSYGSINKNLAEKFVNEIQYPEAKFFYGFQLMMVNIHTETFSFLLDTYVKDEREKDNLYQTAESLEASLKKAHWALNWNRSDSFAERLIAAAAVKGIFFSGTSCSLFWLQKRRLMPGLTFSNDLISRDEALYCDFAVNLHNRHLVNKVPKNRIRAILLDAMEIELEFITESLPVSLIGMNFGLMTQYLEFVTDGLLTKLECEKEFESENPFDFMASAVLEGKGNILEKRVNEFQKAGIISNLKDPNKINFDAD